MLYGKSFDVPVSEDYTVPIGKAKIVRTGSAVTITAFSIMVGKALQAAEKLAEHGISAEVIDLRTIRPLDTATIIASGPFADHDRGQTCHMDGKRGGKCFRW